MKLLNRGSVDKAQASTELGITHLLHCFAGFIILPFRTDSTAVPPHIPVKGKGQVKMCRGSRGIAAGQSTLRALAKGRWGEPIAEVSPGVVGLCHGKMQLSGCHFSRLIFNPSRAGFPVLGMVGMPSQKMRWCWALLQHFQASTGKPRNCCKELWLLQKDAFSKDETMSLSWFCFSVLHVERLPWIWMLRCVGLPGTGRWEKWSRAVESRLACALQRPGWNGVLIPSGP